MSTEFRIVDTFSREPLNGSPSAVVLLDEFSDEKLLQNIAMELNASETVFVKKFNDSDFEISCYCPASKGLLFGNGLFAAAHTLWAENIATKETFSLVFGTRIFEVHSEQDGAVRVRFSKPSINKVTMPVEINRALYGENIVSVAESKNALIVELRSPKKLANLAPNTDIFRHMDYDMVIVTADTHYETDMDYDFCARVFAPKLGIIEDRVTPLAHTRLTSYWEDRIGKHTMVGYQSSRCGGYVRVSDMEGFLYVSGHCLTITKGVLFV